MVPNKFHYMTTDLKRLSNYFGVHLSPPSNAFEAMFEKGTLNAMRFVTAVAEKEKEGDMLVERAGLKAGLSANEVEEILTLSKSQPIKDKLKSVTEEALEHKMFSSGKVVQLFYDVASPYSWLAFEVLCRYRNVWNIDLKFKPAFLPGVIYGSGNQPAVMNPSKLTYIVSDLTLLSEYFGVPMFRPSDLSEKDTLSAMRFVTALAEKEKEGDMLVERAGLKAGLSANVVKEILSLSKSQPIKDKLKSVTQEALEYKCFGFPFIVCQVNGKAKVFFGSDRFELMAYFMGEKWMGPHPNKPTAHM
ncbi:hypothetical protein cypCar_00007237 [Cyprinus carpio]|nr:hypothetical protein cypCar_00007237 [Cyprinus carpio]